MKTVQIHLPSLLFGAALTTLAALTLSAQSTPLKAPLPDQPFVVEHVVKVKGIPAPEDMVRIVEGEPFTVPEERVLVVTGIGGSSAPSGTGQHSVVFDGDVVWTVDFLDLNGGLTSAWQVPPGLAAVSGTAVSTQSSSPDPGILLGYLADA